MAQHAGRKTLRQDPDEQKTVKRKLEPAITREQGKKQAGQTVAFVDDVGSQTATGTPAGIGPGSRDAPDIVMRGVPSTLLFMSTVHGWLAASRVLYSMTILRNWGRLIYF